jgi:hypothetical protein
METTLFVYGACGCLAVIFLVVAYICMKEYEFFGTTACVLMAAVCASPMYYEYPELLEDSVVVEYSESGSIIEHPIGVFCLEGNSTFFTVPGRRDSIPIWTSVYDCTSSAPEKTLNGFGHVVVTDYQKLLSDKPRFENFNSALNAMYKTAQTVIDSVANCSIKELRQFCDDGNEFQQQQFRTFLGERVNAPLAVHGLRYVTTSFRLK